MSPYLRRIDTLAIGDECFNFAARLANRFKVENASNQCLGCAGPYQARSYGCK